MYVKEASKTFKQMKKQKTFIVIHALKIKMWPVTHRCCIYDDELVCLSLK